MKKILLLFIVILSINSVNAQFAENNSIYHSSEITIGNYFGIDIHANYVLKEKYSFKIGYSGLIRKPKSAPEDYTSGIIGIISFGTANPYDKLENFQILGGKIYPLNEKGTIRANVSIGLG